MTRSPIELFWTAKNRGFDSVERPLILSYSPGIVMKLAENGLNSKSTAAAKAVQGQALLHYDRPENFLVLTQRIDTPGC